MSRLLSATSSQGHEAVQKLFDAGGPVLVEVRVPGGIYSSDWYLIHTEEDFDGLLDWLDPNAVLHVSRVRDLANRAGAIVLRR